MANTSKTLKWQISFGITHQLEYQEVIDFFNKVPSKQQGAIGRKLLLAGLQALKANGDSTVLSILNVEQQVSEQTAAQQLQPQLKSNNGSRPNSSKKINNKILSLLECD